jgi:hypothetical protein
MLDVDEFAMGTAGGVTVTCAERTVVLAAPVPW